MTFVKLKVPVIEMPTVICPNCHKPFELPPATPLALAEKFRMVCSRCLHKAYMQENIAPPYQGSGNKSRNIKEKVEEGDNSWKEESTDYK